MIIYLDLTETEYVKYKRKYPVLKDENGLYYFVSKNPYISNGIGLCIGLPEELEVYVIKEK
jgi:hypothetical protein